MVHSNNGASELDAWVGWFADFARLVGAEVSVPAIYEALYNHALTGEVDAGGVMAYNTLSAEPLVGQEAAQPCLRTALTRASPGERDARPAHERLRGRAHRRRHPA